jgi:hypothetical protein
LNISDVARSDARSIFYYYFGAIWQPRAAFDALLKDERRLKFSLIALIITTQLYTLVHILLGFADMGGAPVRQWVDIPVASYFHFEELFATPSIFVGWLLAAGLAQLLTRLVDGKGTFEDMLSVLGMGISVASDDCQSGSRHCVPGGLGFARTIGDRTNRAVALHTFLPSGGILRIRFYGHPARCRRTLAVVTAARATEGLIGKKRGT